MPPSESEFRQLCHDRADYISKVLRAIDAAQGGDLKDEDRKAAQTKMNSTASKASRLLSLTSELKNSTFAQKVRQGNPTLEDWNKIKDSYAEMDRVAEEMTTALNEVLRILNITSV
ncbi:hypothetical protein M426DRAFT_25383 [Hypoxylon sp. CI-4A]|nr:hypothetical protein M426DRAFT_25383 [Hypoxylon sp. CI-4A]